MASPAVHPSVDGLLATENESHRYAKTPHLWALGVGTVIGGEFYGWQSSLIAGFNGLLVILAFVTVLYTLLTFSIAEMSASIPSGGGPIFLYLDALFGLDTNYGPLWWIGFNVIFISLNIMGVEATFRVQVFATMLSTAMLAIFYCGSFSQLDYTTWVVDQNWEWTTWSDSIQGLSFALWFYFGIEEMPLAVDETIEPEKNMPRGIIWSMVTLVILAVLTMVCQCLIYPGAAAMYETTAPLVTGYKSVFGDNSTTAGFMWLTVIGIISSTHSFVYCMSRLLYAIASDGYLPQFLTKVHPTRGSAYAALITGGVVNQILAISLFYIVEIVDLGSVLINLALLGALISYSFQLVSFIMLRINQPDVRGQTAAPSVLLVLCGTSSNNFLSAVITAVILFAVGTGHYYKSVLPRLNSERFNQISPRPSKSLRQNLMSIRSNV
ncbi:amino acid/polyamine transporter [Phytophthora sojae]|uniref:Amino acid/polyamine transporter n=1 Tax=Phytophthora sojae (strain P6497) TaxID=1094619 RepID=G4YK64_PHYSP|nr:amino acid/polyamine transporter [Phytophthora sojae]EGZ27826.1 amino acid/polyamine transporter [Phytophthora sojae]|eukprot:XP_009515101.1 amino acid/polyamine transporter [Phytophthora sojae]